MRRAWSRKSPAPASGGVSPTVVAIQNKISVPIYHYLKIAIESGNIILNKELSPMVRHAQKASRVEEMEPAPPKVVERDAPGKVPGGPAH